MPDENTGKKRARQVPPAAPPQQVYQVLKQEADTRYPNYDWVQNGFQLADGTLIVNRELASGRAFAQHQTEICFVPRANIQNPFLEQLQTSVQQEVQKQLADHSLLEEKRTTFLAKAPLLQIANDILSFTLAAVLPPPTIDSSSDIWTRPLAQDKQFAGHLKKMCRPHHCPASEQQLATGVNRIRIDRNAVIDVVVMVIQRQCMQKHALIGQAEEFVDSSCATLELQQRYKMAYWIVTHAKQFEQVLWRNKLPLLEKKM
ncbi:TPA: hypothetical protein ACH3X1_014456 [Trebouxia sp. C0004]